jgi:hypothetical protein
MSLFGNMDYYGHVKWIIETALSALEKNQRIEDNALRHTSALLGADDVLIASELKAREGELRQIFNDKPSTWWIE